MHGPPPALRALVVVNEKVSGEELTSSLLNHLGPGVEEVFVLAPALPESGAMALINLAHVVGLFLFQSVRYEGIFSRFFARLSLIGTPIALVVSVGLLIVSGN